MVKVLDQFGLQAAIPAVIFGPARPQGLAQLSGSLRVEWKEGELRVLHEGVEQGSARLLRGDVDVAPRAELLNELEHPSREGRQACSRSARGALLLYRAEAADVVFGVGPVDAHENRN